MAGMKAVSASSVRNPGNRNILTGRDRVIGTLARVSSRLSRLPIVGDKVKGLLFDESKLARTWLPNGLIKALSFSGGVATAAIPLPEMIDHPELPFRVMKGAATRGQIAALVDAGYMIRGFRADWLIRLIEDKSKAGKGAGCLNLFDGRALAEELNLHNPGRKFRIPTEDELIKLFALVGDKLLNNNLWFWTETRVNDQTFVLRVSFFDTRFNRAPYDRDANSGVLLVEDK